MTQKGKGKRLRKHFLLREGRRGAFTKERLRSEKGKQGRCSLNRSGGDAQVRRGVEQERCLQTGRRPKGVCVHLRLTLKKDSASRGRLNTSGEKRVQEIM